VPFYRINGMNVHIRGSKRLPPPCSAAVGLQTSDGAPMSACAAPSGFQCDWMIGNGLTCDRHICGVHAFQVGKDKHYCPRHVDQSLEEMRLGGLFTSLVTEGQAT
jgi:hypothetical protein